MERERIERFGMEQATGSGTSDERKESGAAYLRTLKQMATTIQPSPGETISPAQERRRGIRYRCDGSVEFRTAGSDIRTWGTLSDVSMHGCYVEMMATWPVGTAVDLILDAAGVRLRATGEVRVSYPFLGMGIALKVGDEEQASLREMLQRLAARAATAASNDSEPSSTAAPVVLPTFSAASELVKQLARFFETHDSLSKNQFFHLLDHPETHQQQGIRARAGVH